MSKTCAMPLWLCDCLRSFSGFCHENYHFVSKKGSDVTTPVTHVVRINKLALTSLSLSPPSSSVRGLPAAQVDRLTFNSAQTLRTCSALQNGRLHWSYSVVLAWTRKPSLQKKKGEWLLKGLTLTCDTDVKDRQFWHVRRTSKEEKLLNDNLWRTSSTKP